MMISIEGKFAIFSEAQGLSLLAEEATSCVTDGKIYGSVTTPMTVDQAEKLGGALLKAAESTRATKRATDRAAIERALTAARGNRA